nr:uncharacterized protein LOC117685412 isoform X1 [Crassostrea gigas]XP_034315688.1 uncharacterized protein LOC117685412 isoform X1 [Crassostrea gigas]XP_034332366.1 uncharacterized protein LOC117691122 isoform X1 [Crassostrea gigas]
MYMFLPVLVLIDFRKGCDPFDFVPSDVDSDPFSVSNYSPSSDSESDENKKVLESTPNSLRASRNTMEKQGILTLRENSEHFEAESTPNSLRSSRNTMGKRDILTHRENTEYFEQESTTDLLRASRNAMEKQDILNLRENSEHFEQIPYHCFPSLSSCDERSQLDRVSVGVTCAQS